MPNGTLKRFFLLEPALDFFFDVIGGLPVVSACPEAPIFQSSFYPQMHWHSGW